MKRYLCLIFHRIIVIVLVKRLAVLNRDDLKTLHDSINHFYVLFSITVILGI